MGIPMENRNMTSARCEQDMGMATEDRKRRFG